jgi:hypothetical protein
MNRITRGFIPGRRWRRILVVAALVAGAGFAAVPSQVANADSSICADANVAAFGPDVCVFTDTMSQAAIQKDLDSIATQQVPNQFGTQRYAIFFEPGTYGSAADPLVFTIGYYTGVAGLGLNPGGVVINGAIDSLNQRDGQLCRVHPDLGDVVQRRGLPVSPHSRRAVPRPPRRVDRWFGR